MWLIDYLANIFKFYHDVISMKLNGTMGPFNQLESHSCTEICFRFYSEREFFTANSKSILLSGPLPSVCL